MPEREGPVAQPGSAPRSHLGGSGVRIPQVHNGQKRQIGHIRSGAFGYSCAGQQQYQQYRCGSYQEHDACQCRQQARRRNQYVDLAALPDASRHDSAPSRRGPLVGRRRVGWSRFLLTPWQWPTAAGPRVPTPQGLHAATKPIRTRSPGPTGRRWSSPACPIGSTQRYLPVAEAKPWTSLAALDAALGGDSVNSRDAESSGRDHQGAQHSSHSFARRPSLRMTGRFR